MASKKFEKNSPEWKMFMDLWALCQKYWIPEDTDEYWKALCDAADVYTKENRSVLAMKFLMTFLEQKELEVKNDKG